MHFSRPQDQGCIGALLSCALPTVESADKGEMVVRHYAAQELSPRHWRSKVLMDTRSVFGARGHPTVRGHACESMHHIYFTGHMRVPHNVTRCLVAGSFGYHEQTNRVLRCAYVQFFIYVSVLQASRSSCCTDARGVLARSGIFRLGTLHATARASWAPVLWTCSQRVGINHGRLISAALEGPHETLRAGLLPTPAWLTQ